MPLSFNLYIDSAYVASTIILLGMVIYIWTTSMAFNLFAEIQQLIFKRTAPFFVGQLRAI